MTENYRIAGIDIQLIGDGLPSREPLSRFAAPESREPRCRVALKDMPGGAPPYYSYINDLIRWALPDGGGEFFDCFDRDGNLISRALIGPGMREIELYISKDKTPPNHFMKPVMETLFYSLCLFEGGIVLHSAAVDWKGNGILFSAPSGTGKTTHADMWVNNLGAEYINGDRPLLRFFDGVLHVCGTAWSGSSGIYKNVCVPLTAIVFLERRHENRIRPLNPAQALKYMLPRCFLPYHSGNMMAMAMDNVNAVLEKAECWHLCCTPEIGAMELVKECVMTSPGFRG